MTLNDIIDSSRIEPEVLDKYTKPLTTVDIERLVIGGLNLSQEDLNADPIDTHYFENTDKKAIKELNGRSIYDVAKGVTKQMGMLTYKNPAEFTNIANHRLPNLTGNEKPGEPWHAAYEDLVIRPLVVELLGIGDCKCFSMLAIQLMRAEGIPCRAYLIEPIEPITGHETGHCMIEVNYRGEWVVFEPQLGITPEAHENALETIEQYICRMEELKAKGEEVFVE